MSGAAPPKASSSPVPFIVLGVGAVLAVAGGVVAIVESRTLGDDTAASNDKERARSIGRVGFVVMGGGVAIAVVGAVLAIAE